MNEALLYFGPMGVLFVAIIALGTLNLRTNSLSKSFLYSSGIGFVLYVAASLLWFFIFAVDGLAQLIGVFYYALAFVISCLVNFCFLFLITKIKSR